MASSEYSYKGYTFTRAQWSPASAPEKFLFSIYDEHGDEVKSAGMAPMCTSIQQCKNWINNHKRYEYRGYVYGGRRDSYNVDSAPYEYYIWHDHDLVWHAETLKACREWIDKKEA